MGSDSIDPRASISVTPVETITEPANGKGSCEAQIGQYRAQRGWCRARREQGKSREGVSRIGRLNKCSWKLLSECSWRLGLGSQGLSWCSQKLSEIGEYRIFKNHRDSCGDVHSWHRADRNSNTRDHGVQHIAAGHRVSQSRRDHRE